MTCRLRARTFFQIFNTKYLLFYSFMVVRTISDVTSQANETQDNDVFIRWLLINLYTTDVSNLLLAVHSATNWMLFFNHSDVDTRRSSARSLQPVWIFA